MWRDLVVSVVLVGAIVVELVRVLVRRHWRWGMIAVAGAAALVCAWLGGRGSVVEAVRGQGEVCVCVEE